MDTIRPRFIQALMTLVTGVLFIRVARSLTVTNSVTFSTFCSITCCSISSIILSFAASLFSFLCFAPNWFLFLLSFIRA